MNTETRDLVIVTGSSGFIGRAVVPALARQHRVVGMDQECPTRATPEAECIVVDLTSEESVDAAFDRVRFGYGDRIASVVHLAAYYSFSGEPSPLYEEVTVRGTQRLLRALRGFEVEQFVFSSTMLVHAPVEPGRRIDEESPVEAKWDYPQSKIDTEELIRREHGNIPVVILRIAGVYSDRCRSIPIAHQIQRIYERQLQSHLYPGKRTHGQAFIHVDDLVEAIRLVVEKRSELPPFLPLLIGEEETLSYEQLQDTIGELIHGQEWTTIRIPKAVAKAGAWVQDKAPGSDPFIKPWMISLADDHYELDISRARDLLGWSPRRSLRETLPQMGRFLLEQPEQFYRENKLEMPRRIQRQTAAEDREAVEAHS